MSVKSPPSPPTIGPPFADEEPTTQIATNKRFLWQRTDKNTNKRFLFYSDFQTFLLLKAHPVHPQLALQPPHSLKQTVSSYSQLAKPGCKKSREFSRVFCYDTNTNTNYDTNLNTKNDANKQTKMLCLDMPYERMGAESIENIVMFAL